MLFIPTIEKRGNTAAVLLDEPRTFADGLDLDAAREIADALSDRFEIYAIKDKTGFIVMVYDNDECVETVKVESWGDALDVVAQRSADLMPEDSPEDAEGSEGTKIPAWSADSTFTTFSSCADVLVASEKPIVERVEKALAPYLDPSCVFVDVVARRVVAAVLDDAPSQDTKSDKVVARATGRMPSKLDYSPVDALRYLHLGAPLDVALDALDECPDTAELGTVRAAIENAQALIRGEYMHHRDADEEPAFYSNGMPVSTAVPHIANDGKQTFVSPAQHVNHPGDGFRLLTRSADADRYFDGLEDGYVA